jgi:predicted transcriptional regulator
MTRCESANTQIAPTTFSEEVKRLKAVLRRHSRQLDKMQRSLDEHQRRLDEMQRSVEEMQRKLDLMGLLYCLQ